MKRIIILFFAGLNLCTAIPCGASQTVATSLVPARKINTRNLIPYANPMCGTSGNANVFPGAVAPFGMIQWSPDTERGLHKCGYFDEDKRISDFSLDHMSGAGCSYGEDFAFMPIMGGQPTSPPGRHDAFAQPFSHRNEIAHPGYYSVQLENGIKVELAAATRSAFGRFTYPRGGMATMMINAASDINGSAASTININPATCEMSGSSTGGYFCHARTRNGDIRTVYFYAIFDHPFKTYSTWSDNTLTTGAAAAAGTTSGAYVTFDTSNGRTILVRVGISYVSIANAKMNVQAGSIAARFSSTGFNKAVKLAGKSWNSWLNQIQISGGAKTNLQTFYSMLYRALISPSVVSDANGDYFGYDGKIHNAGNRPQYGFFSGWDIYRSECQLLAMIAPKQASDMAQSLLTDYQQGGAFPRWGVATDDSGTMIGDPSAAMIADFYAFGATNFDTQKALDGLLHAATDPSVDEPGTKIKERDGLQDYLKLGYVPEQEKVGSGSVSMTLEYASADFALSQFAKALGDETDSIMLLQHAQNWRNQFNPASGYLEMRRRDGSWTPGFTNNANRYDGHAAYVEGTAAQYLWMVPFNEKGLADMLGGPSAAAQRLDEFLTVLNAGFSSDHAYLGNEPCLETPWIYDFLGQPWRTQSTVRRAIMELYSSQDTGYPGNDDLGEMSSWYIFSALGMYPELPGSDILALGSPLFHKAVLHLPKGDVTIIGHGAAPGNPYVQGLTVNGQPWNKLWVRFNGISCNGKLVYSLGPSSNTNWAGTQSDAPPSYDGQNAFSSER